MNEKLEKRLLKAIVIFNWSVFGGLFLVLVYYGNWILVSDRFIVPSRSMMPTLVPGDRVVVNKLIFGARIYKDIDLSNGLPLQSWRMPGWRKIKKGDVVVFNFPHGYDDGKIGFKINYLYVKRCFGTPGDTVRIDENFNPDHLYVGAFRVPARGDTITLGDSTARRVYRHVIEYETGRAMADTLIERYVFRNNYYYMLGDNYYRSNDSRSWGFVPEDFIVGVARRIVYSRNPRTDKFRWDRLMKTIDEKAPPTREFSLP